jgi:hypothetical protein
MRFVAEMYDTEVDKEFRRFFEWTSETIWRSKLDKLTKTPQFSDAAPYRQYLFNKNPLVPCIAKYFSLTRQGQSVARHLDAEEKRICAYLKLLNRMVYEAKEEVLKRLRGSIFDDDSAAAFLFELQLAIHFFRRGYNVDFTDLEGKARYDLLVSDGAQELEVECKRQSIDAGRKIKKGDFYLLADVLFSILHDIKRRFAVLIKSDGRMGADQKLFQALGEAVEASLRTDTTEGAVANLEFTIEKLPDGLNIRSDADAARALRPFYSGSAYYAVFSNPETVIAIKCESANANTVLNAIYEKVKDGASQLSGIRPGLLACFVEEIEDQDWDILRDDSGLKAIGVRLLSSPSRSHVNLVAFSSDQTPPKREGNVLNFSATHVRYWNPNPKFEIPKSFFSFADR